MKTTNSKILITGGASGIGLGLTKRFIEEGNMVIAIGRRKNMLDELSNEFPAVITKICDLSSATEREELFKWISAEHSDLNILVNNAGIQQWMAVEAFVSVPSIYFI